VDSVVACTEEPYRLLFVDNASSDGTVPYLQERFGRDAVLSNSSNEASSGRRTGARVGQRAVRLLLNNDTAVTPRWLSALRGAAERSPEFGIVGGKIVGPDGRVQVAGLTWPSTARPA